MASLDPARNSDSDVSPKTPVVPDQRTPKTEYFPPDSSVAEGSGTSVKTSEADGSSARRSSLSLATEPPKPSDAEVEDEGAKAARRDTLDRKSSVSSVTFRRPRNPSLPQGDQKRTDAERIRASSPPHDRFQRHVAFDNLPLGEATKHNTPALTLSTKHKGYKARRRSRTFMIGVDENAYSDYALQWLLDELVDEGDELICVRVIEKDIRVTDKQYQEDGQLMLQSIMDKAGSQRAISITLEWAVGRLHTTFQRLIYMYQPAMLIVGTRGRSLGGIQGLVNTRNSFSKYCLQYSPVPVIIVRPTEKRIKKKVKRANDATRKNYLAMLANTNGKHETDVDSGFLLELEAKISADEEAHQVAKVLGLPASFDPTIKPIHSSQLPRSPGPSNLQVSQGADDAQRGLTPASSNAGVDSDSDSDEEDGDFEVMSGEQALDSQHKIEQLHKMEAAEAAALKMPVNEDSDSDSDSDGVQGQASAGVS